MDYALKKDKGKYSRNNELKAFRKMKHNDLMRTLQELTNEKLKRVASLMKGAKTYAQVKESRGSVNRINKSIARAKTVMLENTRGVV